MARRALFLALLLSSLTLGGCGLAESIAGAFVDDQDVVLPVNVGRSGTVVRDTSGVDVTVQPATFLGGDTAADHFCFCVLGFSIDPSQQPGNTKIKRATLRVWIDYAVGDPTPLAPVVVSHLPNHPDQPLTVGLVPHPPGTDLGTIADVTTPGWREIDVTPFLLADWNAGRSISAFAARLSVMTDGDGETDTLAFQAPGGQARAELVLTFTLDL